MVFEEKLKKLVRGYAVYNEDTHTYETIRNPDSIELGRYLIELISEELGPHLTSSEELKKHYHKLSLVFHPDKFSYIPEAAWLENILSEGQNNGICFKNLNFCYSRLNPNRAISSKEVKNFQDFKEWLILQRSCSELRSQRDLYDSLIRMINQMDINANDNGLIESEKLRKVVAIIPICLGAYCAFLFAEELLAIYGLCFIAAASGKLLNYPDSSLIKELGNCLSQISAQAANLLNLFLVKSMETSFWITNQSFLTMYQIVSTLFLPRLADSPDAQAQPVETMDNVLALVEPKFDPSYHFITPALKNAALFLLDYIETTKTQRLGSLRAGYPKVREFEKVLATFQVIDRSRLDDNEKKNLAKMSLDLLRNNPTVCGNGKNALWYVRHAFQALDEDYAFHYSP